MLNKISSFKWIDVKTSKIGNRLSDFKIISYVGKGSFGSVYKVKSVVDHKIYILKKISKLSTLKKSHQDAAVKEVIILKKLNHPHIIKYVTSFVEWDCLYIIQEWAESGDLQKLIKKARDKNKRRLKENDLWDILYQILLGIEYLHENKIIHRDLKPLNIFMSANKVIKLGDFGVSRIVKPGEISSKRGGIVNDPRVGTPLYLAPELVKQLPYDYKADMWALGWIMYFLTSLAPPFTGHNLITLANNITGERPKELPDGYSERYKEFIYSLLSK